MRIISSIGNLLHVILTWLGITQSADNPFRVFSFGGGVQSTAVLVLQSMGKLPKPYHAFVFCNVGDDSENPDTIIYINDVILPFCKKHGIVFIIAQKKLRGGALDTLLQAIYRPNRSVDIPAWMPGGAPGNRSCTEDFKILVLDKLIKSYKVIHWCVVGLGISTDEFRRARDVQWHDNYGKTAKIGFNKKREYPLIDLRLSRVDCERIIAEAGLPPAPKSSCWFCPFMPFARRLMQKQRQPDLFKATVDVERTINNKRSLLGKDRLYIMKIKGKPVPLETIDNVDASDLNTTPDESCDEGVCMT